MPTQTRFSMALLLLLLSPLTSTADEVKLVRREAFRNVRVIDCRDGVLHFRGVSQQILKKPLDQVEFLAIDSIPALAEAERPTDNDHQAAAQLLQRLHQQSASEWQRQLLRLRHVQALQRVSFDAAVAGYLQLLQDRIPGATFARPSRPGAPGDPQHAAARARLRTARSLGTLRAHKDDLLLLELELLLWDDVRPLPRPFRDYVAAGRERQEVPDDAPAAMFADIPLETSDALELPAASFAFRAIDEACDLQDYDQVRSRLALIRSFVPDESPDLLLREARLALTKDPARALRPLKSLRESHPDLPIGAQATYYEGLAYERLERADLARSMWQQLLRSRGASEQLRAFAEEKLGSS